MLLLQAPLSLAHYGVKERLQARWRHVVQGAPASAPAGELVASECVHWLAILNKLK